MKQDMEKVSRRGALTTKQRASRVAAVTTVALFAMVGNALAAAGDATYSLSGATDGIVDQVTGVLTTVLPIAGGLIALTIGWKLLKKMTKSA